ncbi:hypothetical protein [Streptomyces thioluteus]|uniref:hypothetical protein n=1 Tax=Streptomyces thioluteus TaxID=66431 RepID=UPI0031EA7E19
MPVDGLKGQRITGVRVAPPTGWRIALLVANGDRFGSCGWARVERQGSGGDGRGWRCGSCGRSRRSWWTSTPFRGPAGAAFWWRGASRAGSSRWSS